MNNNFPKAYKEVMEILNFVPKQSVDKIPQTMLKTFESSMDKNYNFTVDINKSFEEQNLLDETKAIFANIFRDYWATPYQKERIEIKEKYDRQKIEEEKRSKYNVNNLFVKREEKLLKTTNNFPIEYNQDKFYKKIINFFIKLFHIS